MTRTARSLVTASLCAAALTAQFVSGKATRDALFLTSLGLTALPTMLIATSLCSILLVALHGRLSRRIPPATLVTTSFVLSGVLFVCEWLTRSTAPSVTAVIVYLHVSGSGPLLASGFWLTASERFDPRTAKKRFGQIAGAGTLGGLVGALLSERVAAGLGVPAMLLFLAVFQFLAAWMVWLLAYPAEATTTPAKIETPSSFQSRSGLQVIAGAPHLRQLALLVLLGTTSAALLEYLFTAKAVETFGPGDNLLRFFALYYAAISLMTFVLQTFSSRFVLERFGLALTTSTPSIALMAGGLGSIVAPGLGGLLVARGGESIFRGSWFRAGYELFYTPLPPAEKRAAKSLIDVAFDRLGDAIGGGFVRLSLFAPLAQSSTVLALAMASAAGAFVAASRLNRWYVRTLEASLLKRGRTVQSADTEDKWTEQLVLKVREAVARGQEARRAALEKTTVFQPESVVSLRSLEPDLNDILSLRSQDHDRVIEILSRQDGMRASLVPHVIALLASDTLADPALFALRKVAEERVGELTDSLLDGNLDDTVRCRLARVFAVCVSQRAADGLVLGLDDARFDVRFQSARSLAAILEKNPVVQVDPGRIYALVLREVAVGRPVWDSRRLLDGFISPSPLDEFVRDRAGQSLAHVFTLLSLVLPREPLQIAFHSLHSDDRQLRGTALEYLEGVLPTQIRHALWPFLMRPRTRRPAKLRHSVVAQPFRAAIAAATQG
jgi:ATP:ADP antiporter, AAA family